MAEKADNHETNDNDDGEVTYPLNVIYCARCGLPPEFCSFGQKDTSQCKQWLKETHPVLHREIYGDDEKDGATGKDQAKATGDAEE